MGTNIVHSNGTSNGVPIIRWDPKNLEIKSMTVERTLEPIVMQVS